ncbi:iron-containing alcohol dehydrogenase [Pedobacter sp. SD-b]|uniref:Iron-containing alcohol dehydrogenase n=1 Tax=Pedobacter segetis TaxID=2793069 RepID=A0ABS1BFU1_9SPHI|nr:iron-containing alcohol dehydrogenase [Pedobacter segetis]MBK0381728.1 iron-containing alcohol dehydrogenase [Pedobacter segetis]
MDDNKFLIGKNVLDQLCAECGGVGKKAIIVTKKNLNPYIGLYARVLSLLNICGLEHVTFQCDQQKPAFSDAEQAIKIAKNKEVNFVIAIGCKAIIEVAKATAIGFYANCPISDFYKDDTVSPSNALPIYNILTERELEIDNQHISLFKDKNENKLFSKYLIPKVSFLDLDYVRD